MPKQIITTKAENTLDLKAISISNRKGGVGKTTFTTVIGEELDNAGYSVVMLDLDSQTNLTDINLSQKDDSKFFDLLIGQKALDEVVVEPLDKGDKKNIPGSAGVNDTKIRVTISSAKVVEVLKQKYKTRFKNR